MLKPDILDRLTTLIFGQRCPAPILRTRVWQQWLVQQQEHQRLWTGSVWIFSFAVTTLLVASLVGQEDGRTQLKPSEDPYWQSNQFVFQADQTKPKRASSSQPLMPATRSPAQQGASNARQGVPKASRASLGGGAFKALLASNRQSEASPSERRQQLVNPNEVLRGMNLPPANNRSTPSSPQFQEQESFLPGARPATQIKPMRSIPFNMEVDWQAFGAPPQAEKQNTEQASPDTELEQLPMAIESRPAQPDQEKAESPATVTLPKREIVIENHPNGRPRIQRSVVMDKEGNYLQDGPWKVFSEDGQLVAQGVYEKGVMVGNWGRRHVASEGGLFGTKPFTLYTGPFDSYATFREGKLHGMWRIYNGTDRAKIFEIGYRDGKRHGQAVWYYPDQQRMRVANFVDGILDGEVREWEASPEHRLTALDVYIKGRKVVRTTASYRPDQKQAEATYLDQRLEPDGLDNWWDAKPAPLVPTGTKVQQGPVASWFANGQPQYRGQYRDDHPIGRFFWWHENGNRKTTGQFDENGRRTGSWIWWHPNGMKSFEGQYEDGMAVGVWRSWFDDGQLRKKRDYDAAGGEDFGPELNGASQDDRGLEAIEAIESTDPSDPVNIAPDTQPRESSPAKEGSTEDGRPGSDRSSQESTLGDLPISGADSNTSETENTESAPAKSENGDGLVEQIELLGTGGG